MSILSNADAALATTVPGPKTAAAPGHVTQVRQLVFDRLTPDQVAELEAISRRITRDGGA